MGNENEREKGPSCGSNYTKKIQPIKPALTAAKHRDMIMRTWLLLLLPHLPSNFTVGFLLYEKERAKILSFIQECQMSGLLDVARV